MVIETVPTKTGKGVLKRTKISAKKTSDSETVEPMEEPFFETIEPIVETVPMENLVPSTATITQEGEPAMKKIGSKRIKKNI